MDVIIIASWPDKNCSSLGITKRESEREGRQCRAITALQRVTEITDRSSGRKFLSKRSKLLGRNYEKLRDEEEEEKYRKEIWMKGISVSGSL